MRRARSDAYADESIRGRDYIMCVSLIPSSDARTARRKLRGLAARGQRRIHFATESDKRRRALLSQIATVGTSSVIYVARHRDQVAARSAIVEVVTADLLTSGVTFFVLESREGQDHRDRAIIAGELGTLRPPPFGYTHRTPGGEPLLWVPDAVAWAWGRGNKWRTTIRELGLVIDTKRVEVS